MELKYRGAPVVYSIKNNEIIGVCKIRKKEYSVKAKDEKQLLEEVITLVDKAL
jgi:hypothetical protein